MSAPSPTPETERLWLLRCINAASLAGFHHYARALRTLYDRRYGFRTVTGADFGRSLAWARRHPTALSRQLADARLKAQMQAALA
jgi:hypothetical protein